MNVDLNTIGNGALRERFNREFEKVVKNMKDPNTSFKEARKISITLSFKQDEDRSAAACTIEVSSKLAKAKSFDTNFAIGQDLRTNQYIAKEYGTQIPGQLGIDDVMTAVEEGSNVKEFANNRQKLSPAIGG